MEDAAAITSLVKKKEDILNDLHERMDDDFERWELKRTGYASNYDIIKKNRGGVRSTDINITSNAPRTFADSVQAILTASIRQIIVRMAETGGEDKREEIGNLERLLEFAFEKADERLIQMLQPSLSDQLWWYSIARGWVAGRFLVYKDGKDIIFDFNAQDPRWSTYQVGANGLLWTAYKTERSAEELVDEYDAELSYKKWYKPWEKKSNGYEVIDYWKYEGERTIINAVICNNAWLKEPETHDMLSMPVLISPVPTRPLVRSSSGTDMVSYGESIFAPNRDIDDLINDLGSMWASHANLLAKQPIINYYADGGVTELKDTVHYAEGILDLPMGLNRLEPTPMKEISPTLINMVNWMDSMRVRGSLPDIDIGKPPPSGTLYNLVQETSNRVYNPQLRNMNAFYANICRLVEEQLITSKLKVKGNIERKLKYYEVAVTPVDLKKEHTIKVEFTARTPWTQLDMYQIADMASRLGVPRAWIWENILKMPDPKGLSDLAAIEVAEHSPKLLMLQAIKALMDAGRGEEAVQLISDMYQMEMQEQQGSPQGAPEVAPETIPAEMPPEGEMMPPEVSPELSPEGMEM